MKGEKCVSYHFTHSTGNVVYFTLEKPEVISVPLRNSTDKSYNNNK